MTESAFMITREMKKEIKELINEYVSIMYGINGYILYGCGMLQFALSFYLYHEWKILISALVGFLEMIYGTYMIKNYKKEKNNGTKI